jgi:protein TonB
MWVPGDIGASFSMQSGNGGTGAEWAPIGSTGGAATSAVFYVEMPAISAAAEAPDYQAPNFSLLAARAQESEVKAETPTVSAIKVSRQERTEEFVAATTPPTLTEELRSKSESTNREIERKQEAAVPEPTEPTDDPPELQVARNIAVAPTVAGAAIVVDLPEKAQSGETTIETTAVSETKTTKQEQAEPQTAATTRSTATEQIESQPKPTSTEIERKQEHSPPESTPTEPLEKPSNLPVLRSIAAAPTVDEAEVELPPVQVSNGRGQDGLGTGNTQGAGNGGARGRVGGDFDSFARGGPLNPSPSYPPAALSAGIEGIVHVRFHIAADGSVKSAIVETSGHEILDDAVRIAIKTWRFEPARRGGVGVESMVRVPFDFFLRRR